MSGPTMEELYAQQVQAEESASALVPRVFDILMEEAGPWAWHWQDGRGGWFLGELTAAAERAGLPVPEHNLSLPPVGPTHHEIYERDAYRCQECGDWHDLTIDHIIPRARGGTNDPENLRVLCRGCNSRKGAR